VYLIDEIYNQVKSSVNQLRSYFLYSNILNNTMKYIIIIIVCIFIALYFLHLSKNEYFSNSDDEDYSQGKNFLESFKNIVDNVVENFNKDKNRVNDIINDCVQTISANGIYKPHDNKQNFLGHFDNNTLWTIISFCVVALTTGSFYIGKYHERSELLINHISTNSNSISTSDTTSNPKNNNIRQDIKDNYIDSITKDK
jgi:Na+/H+ antiporter NhaC